MKVELVDRMGNDLTVVNAARVSFDKESQWEEEDWDGWFPPTKILSDKDRRLISYLAKHDHWTPFSHVMITMRETVPIFVARQRFKHMVGFTYNEVSRRYVSDEPSFYIPDSWRKAAENKKQGSSDETVELLYVEGLLPEPPANAYERFILEANELYHDMIENGVAPEQARMVLPQSMYTSYYVTGSLAAWARAYKLRSNPDAQKEIQELAGQWNSLISDIPELEHSWRTLTS